jgi:hypothetical protein
MQPWRDDDPSWWEDEDLLMAIDLGYDESGSGDILIVSAQIAITEQAKKFRRKWRKRLGEAGIPYFHAKEFGNIKHGVFAGLNREEREELLTDLCKLVHRHVSGGISAKVTKSLYEQKTTQEFRSRWGTHYTFAIQMLVQLAYVHANRSGLRPYFNVLIEDGHRHAAQAINTLNQAKKSRLAFPMESKLLTVGLGSKADHPILQAADMLGYSLWQQLNDSDTEFPMFKALHLANDHYNPWFVDLDPELVDIAKEGIDKWAASRKAFGQRRVRDGGV